MADNNFDPTVFRYSEDDRVGKALDEQYSGNKIELFLKAENHVC